MTGTSLITTMAERYHMEPAQFALTVRKTVLPTQHTNEEFAAFMMVCYEYGLNPILRQIYAYPKKGGGIQPVVSLDGWVHLINTHPQFDGLEVTFVEQPGPPPAPDKPRPPPVSATCTMWRKDRSHPTVVTEYYSECVRNSEPWSQMPRRMLRHKALKEAARVAFGFAGIADDDEGRDVASSVKRIQEPIVVESKALDDWAASADAIDQSTGSSSSPPAHDEPGDTAGDQSPQPPPRSPADLRQDAINEMLILATGQQDRQQCLETLEARLPVWEDRIGERLAAQITSTAVKVAKGELAADKARTYLEGLK
jgi:phage recombination protein Bet